MKVTDSQLQNEHDYFEIGSSQCVWCQVTNKNSDFFAEVNAIVQSICRPQQIMLN